MSHHLGCAINNSFAAIGQRRKSQGIEGGIQQPLIQCGVTLIAVQIQHVIGFSATKRARAPLGLTEVIGSGRLG